MSNRAKNQTAFILISALTGLIFGFGLVISGMSNPAKVIGFLNLSEPWDPSLAFVMGGAIAVGLPGFYWAKKQKKSLLGLPMNIPNQSNVDKNLLAGAVMFGLGWGLGGFCPGPALVSASAFYGDALIFVVAMLAGMALFSFKNN
ncbi:MAG: DUF6691 family protein [Limnobacter sp.]|nr:DUF6691 family protein [Limnobacter sp.]